MEILIILMIIIAVFFLFTIYAKERTKNKERERAGTYPPVTVEMIKNGLDLYFLTKKSKEMKELLNDNITITARTYSINNNYNSVDTFLAVKENLKKELEKDYIFINSIDTKKMIDANSITEYMQFYNNDDCLLMVCIMSNDRYLKGQHTIIISLVKKIKGWDK